MKWLKSIKRRIKKSVTYSYLVNSRYLPRWIVLLMDVLLCVFSYALSVLVGSQLFMSGSFSGLALFQLGMTMFIQLIFFQVFHTYAGILRYSTFDDAIKVGLAVVSTGVTILIINLIARQCNTQIFLNTVTVIYEFTAIVLLTCLRVSVKMIYEYVMKESKHAQRVLIYGTKSAGLAIAKMLRSNTDSNYNPYGFISDLSKPVLKTLLGLKVYSINEDLFAMMKDKNINSIIVSPLKMKEINPATDLNIFIDHNIQILCTPEFKDIEAANAYQPESEKKLSNVIGRISAIRIEDLLERPTIKINTDNVRQIIENKVVMVTGAAGSIGSELVRQVIKYKPSLLVLFEQAESPLHELRLEIENSYPDQRFIPCIGDVRNRDRIREVMSEHQPQVIFHAAAYKHVPLMEEHPNEAIKANVLGTKNMADLAVEFGVERFVMISTDKAVNPTNVMGASKRLAEIYVQSLYKKLVKENPDCTQFITTRFGNVLGSNGSVIPYFKKQISEGGPVTVTHRDIIRYFMTIPEACTLVMEAATLGHGGEIFVFDMGQPVKIYDLAKKMIRLAGFEPEKDIQIIFTGLRPGEKLYEELLNMKETTLPTTNEKIMIAKVREFDFDEVSKEIESLIAISQKGNSFNTVSKMKSIVPEYKSKNSIYEQLDK